MCRSIHINCADEQVLIQFVSIAFRGVGEVKHSVNLIFALEENARIRADGKLCGITSGDRQKESGLIGERFDL
jgi:hypothetical protein